MGSGKNHALPFNRTSMESKLDFVVPRRAYLPPFNRTSMESKPFFNVLPLKGQVLLIEPVWNRNAVKLSDAAILEKLLIEPVWNRNTIISL